MILSVSHVTLYRYDAPVRGIVQSHRLSPSVHEGQKPVDWSVQVTGGIAGPGFRDGAGDWVQGWAVRGPVAEIAVEVRGSVETQDTSGVLRGHREVIPPAAYLRDTAATTADDALAALGAGTEGAKDRLDRAHALSRAVAEAIAYVPGATEAQTTAAQALALGRGVCQDHAHALIAAARSSGIPARYVAGYLLADGAGAAHEAGHAWAELHVEGLGWVGFDPANACCPDDRYIRLGSGLDAQMAAPIRGTSRGPGAGRLDVTVAVQAVQQ